MFNVQYSMFNAQCSMVRKLHPWNDIVVNRRTVEDSPKTPCSFLSRFFEVAIF